MIVTMTRNTVAEKPMAEVQTTSSMDLRKMTGTARRALMMRIHCHSVMLTMSAKSCCMQLPARIRNTTQMPSKTIFWKTWTK